MKVGTVHVAHLITLGANMSMYYAYWKQSIVVRTGIAFSNCLCEYE